MYAPHCAKYYFTARAWRFRRPCAVLHAGRHACSSASRSHPGCDDDAFFLFFLDWKKRDFNRRARARVCVCAHSGSSARTPVVADGWPRFGSDREELWRRYIAETSGQQSRVVWLDGRARETRSGRWLPVPDSQLQ